MFGLGKKSCIECGRKYPKKWPWWNGDSCMDCETCSYFADFEDRPDSTTAGHVDRLLLESGLNQLNTELGEFSSNRLYLFFFLSSLVHKAFKDGYIDTDETRDRNKQRITAAISFFSGQYLGLSVKETAGYLRRAGDYARDADNETWATLTAAGVTVATVGEVDNSVLPMLREYMSNH